MKTVKTTEKYDNNGMLIEKIVETTETSNEKTETRITQPYPQYPSSTGTWRPPWVNIWY